MNSKLKFSGNWRDYQKRILDDLNFHLADNKIHIVAAPGAGKTTLGIEVISRINKPTLVLAPTITIRNQWKQRIISSFLEDDFEDVLSTNIREPKFITIITYQALLAAFCGSKENDEEVTPEEDADEEKITSSKRFRMDKADDIIKILSDSGIKLLCFDEAHHLRKEWWKALDYLVENLKPEQSVALTATPPYDAEGKEWERYENLCGSIDEIISIPELVANGDLCPHQDFIHFSVMRKHENEKMKEYLKNINEFLKSLLQNNEIIRLVLKQLRHETDETILDEPKLYMAISSYLKAAGENVPQNILELFDLPQGKIPTFHTEYQKLFLNYLFNSKDKFTDAKEVKLISELAKKARTAGILQNKMIFLNDSPKFKRQIANSIGKLDSIKKIVDLEVRALRNDLRMVILADYIKADNLDASVLGVIPIWQILKERNDISLAVLTGSIILIPTKLQGELIKYITSMGLEDCISVNPFDRDNNYLKITSKGSKKSCVVELITQMFNEGHITVMVGTQALLGEGWDAPCINSLILSSTVSSYMLSNQMRGRAIRIDKNNPAKISNIWHLASIKILTPGENFMQMFKKQETDTSDNVEQPVQLFDYSQLYQRFKGFQAPSISSPFYIESGIERILPVEFILRLTGKKELREKDFLNLNRIMECAAVSRQNTKALWDKGLEKQYDAPQKMLRNGVSSEIQVKNFIYKNGYFAQLAFAFMFWTTVWAYLGNGFMANREFEVAFVVLFVCVLGFVIMMFKPTVKYIKCSSPDKIMRQIGIVFLETLYAMGKIKENLKNVSIRCKMDPTDKTVFFSVENISPEENNLLIKCILEFLNPIDNPRYLFVRKGKIAKAIETTDYHAMPGIISQCKNDIDIFRRLWQKYIGKCDMIYTRNPEGRRMLLKARKDAFSDLVRSPKAKQLSRFE